MALLYDPRTKTDPTGENEDIYTTGPISEEERPGLDTAAEYTPTTDSGTTTTGTTAGTTETEARTPAEMPEWEKTYKGAENYFDPMKGTVQGRLKGLLENPNALMKQQESQALRASNARGLLNTTMATEAGQSALIGAALPIAQQDADTYRQMYAQDASYDYEKDFELQAQKFQKMMQEMGIASDERMQSALLAAQERIKGLEISSEEKQMFGSAMAGVFNNIIAQMTALMRDENLDGPALDAALEELYANLDDSLGTLGDLFGYQFDFT